MKIDFMLIAIRLLNKDNDYLFIEKFQPGFRHGPGVTIYESLKEMA